MYHQSRCLFAWTPSTQYQNEHFKKRKPSVFSMNNKDQVLTCLGDGDPAPAWAPPPVPVDIATIWICDFNGKPVRPQSKFNPRVQSTIGHVIFDGLLLTWCCLFKLGVFFLYCYSNIHSPNLGHGCTVFCKVDWRSIYCIPTLEFIYSILGPAQTLKPVDNMKVDKDPLVK